MDIVVDADLYYNVVVRTGTTRYFTLSAVMIFAWDWVTHLDEEVSLIWMRDWSLAGKPMYLFLRYVGFSFQVYDLISMMGVWDEKFCYVYFYALPCGTVVFLYLVDILLAYRVVCLYHANRKLLIFNGIVLLCSALTTIIILSFSLPQYVTIATPAHLTGCWAKTPSFDFASCIPPIIFELWIFGLVLYKIYQCWTDYNGFSIQTAFMAKLLIRDQMSWFSIIAGVITWTVIQLSLAPRGLRGIALPFFRSLVCICGCRLVLHLRKSYYGQMEARGLSQTEDHDDLSGVTRGIILFAPAVGLPPLHRTDLLTEYAEAGADLSMEERGATTVYVEP
jgi:hypothetical protein